jgi:CheY-like chemotaxis protein
MGEKRKLQRGSGISGAAKLMSTSQDPLQRSRNEVRRLTEELLSYSHQFNNLLVGIEGSARLLVVEGLISKEGDSLIAGLLDSVRRAALLSESIQHRYSDIDPASVKKSGTSEDAEVKQSGQSGTILVIDDEEIVRSVSKEILFRAGYRVFTAESGEQALAIYESRKSEIDCVLLDLTMPYMSGNLVYARLKALNQDVRVVLMSGYCDENVLQRFEGIASFLPKPFSPEKLVHSVNDAAKEILLAANA